MEQSEYLKKNVFKEMKNLNDGFDEADVFYFSETDFEQVLKEAEYTGISIYTIKPWFDGSFLPEVSNEDHKKKATDSRWYKKAFRTFKLKQENLLFSATYKVPAKLLAR